MLNNDDWLEPTAPAIDHMLRDLTEHAVNDIADDGKTLPGKGGDR